MKAYSLDKLATIREHGLKGMYMVQNEVIVFTGSLQ